MRRTLLHLFLLCAGATIAPAQPFSHDLLDGVLRTHVDCSGMVDYAALKAHPASLAAYIDSLAETSPHNRPERFPDRSHELAYWMNAYNAFVLWGVVEAYPVPSVKDIGILSGFFNRHEFHAGGKDMTLNHIENEIIRPVYQEPRIHFAINCGAFSCPSLAQRAYSGATLDAQLEQAVVRFTNDAKHVRLGPDGELHLSKILEWYSQDFVDWFPAERPKIAAKPNVIDYLLPYLPVATAAHLRQHPGVRLVYNDYDWALNEQKSAPSAKPR
jgi:hypothetical protein